MLFYASLDDIGEYFMAIMATSRADWEALGVDFSSRDVSIESGGGDRRGEGQDGGNQAKNGLRGKYAGEMVLGHPKTWTNDEIYQMSKLTSEKIEEMKNKVNDNLEVGYLYKYNSETNTLSAVFYYGLEEGKWMNMRSKPNQLNLGENESIIGFYHTHLNYDWHRGDNKNVLQFSGGDFRSYYSLMINEFGWARGSKSYNTLKYYMVVSTAKVDQIMSMGIYDKARTNLWKWIKQYKSYNLDYHVWGIRNWSDFGYNLKQIWRKP